MTADSVALLSSIDRPTLLLDRDRALRNIARMQDRARNAGAALRPHFKTHQSVGVGRWFREVGITAITVSSVDMAAYFAADNWKDITIAFPCNLRQMAKINELSRDAALGLLVDSRETVQALGAGLQQPVDVWIEVDAGFGRSGVRWDRPGELAALAMAIEQQPLLTLAGVLNHAGNTYSARSPEAVANVGGEAHTRDQAVRDQLQAVANRPLKVSIGDTPSASVGARLDVADEIRPGNFVFYDAQQLNIGSCCEADVAAIVACPVVAKYDDRREVVLYGGAVHLSKDVVPLADGPIHGYAVDLTPDGWGAVHPLDVVTRLSQEHGIARLGSELWDSIHVGDLLGVVPAHVCLTVSALRAYRTLDGELIEATGGA